MFINFLDCNFLILRLQLLLIERVKIEVALMLLRVTVLRAEHIFATTLHSQQANLLFACPTLSLIILTQNYDQKVPVTYLHWSLWFLWLLWRLLLFLGILALILHLCISHSGASLTHLCRWL